MSLFCPLRIVFISFIALFSQQIFAHPGHTESGLLIGFMHPFLGLDHIIAMLAIGLWAGQLGKKATIQIPSMFVLVMVFACALAVIGLQVPYVEQGIIFSVIFLGVLLFASFKFSTPVCAALVACFAFFHGAAHGVEMPTDIHASLYVLGFAVASAVLHLIGVLLNQYLIKANHPIVTRLTGLTIFAAGISLSLT